MDRRSIALSIVSSVLLCTIGVKGTGQCQQELANTNAKPGAFVPQCTDKGHYQVIQTHGSTGYAWCVDPKSGVKIEGTETSPTSSPTCPTCLTQLADKLEGPAIGAYQPQCDQKTGNFKPKQTWASTGTAWCADPVTGNQLTKPSRNTGTLKCNAARSKRHAGMGQCAQAYENSMPQAMPGKFRAQCTEKGHYQVIQRHGSTGYSWCVDPVSGVKIEGSDAGPGADAQCPACLTQLANKLEGPAVGAYRPQCDAKTGNFKPKQTWASTGTAWCADPVTGNQLTQPSRNDGTLKCDAARSKRHAGMGRCAQSYENSMPQTMPGQFRAQCTEKGHYQVVQRHGSTGYSWCVDPVYGVKIEGSDAGPGADAQCPACLNELSKKLEGPAVGAYKPQCDAKTGNYKKVQTWASTGTAWCADPTTGKQLTTPTRNDGALNCDGFVSGVARRGRTPGRCQQEVAHSSGLMGAFTPSCTEKGNYQLIQVHGSSGYSWCVDPVYGVKIEGTSVGPTGGQPQCPACVTQLSKSLDLIGSYRPQCDTNGNFKPVQVHASTGLAWCADPSTGKQLTDKVRNDGTLKC